LGFSPALLPRLVGPDGKEVIFDAGALPKRALRAGPAVRYIALSRQAAWPGDVTRVYNGRALRCVTLRPGRVLAGQGSTLVLRPGDKAILAERPHTRSLLGRGMVVIIVDRK
jgi:hypothetical protein